MDYPIRTISQLRPVLQGFRKAHGLTQAQMAARLGITQQTYARLEANPDRASVERIFRVLQALGVDLVLSVRAPSGAGTGQGDSNNDSGNAGPRDGEDW